MQLTLAVHGVLQQLEYFLYIIDLYCGYTKVMLNVDYVCGLHTRVVDK